LQSGRSKQRPYKKETISRYGLVIIALTHNSPRFFAIIFPVSMQESQTLTGQDLVNALIARDDSTWRTFLRDIGPMLHGVCFKNLLSDDEFNDLAQMVVEKLLDRDCRILRRLKIKDDKSFYAWVKIVISRTALDYIRTARVRTEREFKWAKNRAHEFEQATPETERIETRAMIEKAALRFPPLDQLLLWLKYEETPDSEMARITGLSITAIEQRLSRLRRKLREILSESDNPDIADTG
jgi:RNA polymerase sigma factor (sigma-70 family)